MSATQVIEEIKTLPRNEQEEVFTFLAQKLIEKPNVRSKSYVGKKLSFDEACDVVFRENRELLNLLAK